MDSEPVLDHMTAGVKRKKHDDAYQEAKTERRLASPKEYCDPPQPDHVEIFMKRMSDNTYEKDKKERQLAYQKKHEGKEEASQRNYYIAHKESKKAYQKTYHAQYKCQHGHHKGRCSACDGSQICEHN